MNKREVCNSCPAAFDPCLWQGTGDTPAHIIVIAEAPSNASLVANEAFAGKEGRLFKKFLDMLKKTSSGVYKNLKVYYTYAVLAGAVKPTASHVTCCQTNLLREIGDVQGIKGSDPVIVTLGPLALKAIGVHVQKLAAVVGREMTTSIPTTLGRKKYTVFPNLSMKNVLATPGVAQVVLATLAKAANAAMRVTQKEKTLDELTKDYIFPKTIEEVEDLVTKIIHYADPLSGIPPDDWTIALDTETNTLHPFSHENPKTLMLSVAWGAGKAATILLDHPDTPYDREAAWAQAKRLLQCPKPKVFHNFKFDTKFLGIKQAIPIERVAWDTLLGEHYIDEDKKGYYSLKQLTSIYCPGYAGYDDDLQAILRGSAKAGKRDRKGIFAITEKSLAELLASDERTQRECLPQDLSIDVLSEIGARMAHIEDQRKRKPKDRVKTLKELNDDLKDFMGLYGISLKKTGKSKTSEGGFEDIPLETILRYAAVDADVTRQIMREQSSRLNRVKQWKTGKQVMDNFYLPGSDTLSKMEYRGFKLDVPYLSWCEVDAEKRIASLRKKMDALAPGVNLNAPQQLAEWMTRLNFEMLPGIEPGSTAKEALVKYIDLYPEGDIRHDFVDTLKEYREVSQALKLYLKPLRGYMHRDEKVHCNFNLNGTATGRLSSSEPNLQNISGTVAKKGEHPGYNLKKIFIPSDPKNVIVNVDISGAELRVYCAYSHDKLFTKAILDGLDTHSFVQSKIFKVPYEEILANKKDPLIKKNRVKTKRTVFGTLYGAGPSNISRQIDSTVEEARELQQFLFTEFPDLKKYIETVTKEVESNKMVSTYLGRYRRFKLASVSDSFKYEAIREAINFKIQSTSSDLVLGQLCEIDKHIHELEGQLLVTVHDSICFEMPPRNIPKLKPFLDHWIVERVKEKYSWLPVPFLYDVEIGPNYGELKELEAKDGNGDGTQPEPENASTSGSENEGEAVGDWSDPGFTDGLSPH